MPPPSDQRSFITTRWSLLRRAVSGEEDEAMEHWCEMYWTPLYAYFRRLSGCAEDAEDLTQGFFCRLLQGEMLAGADPERGRLRTYLLACARNHWRDARDRALAKKRGAEVLTTFDLDRAEAHYAEEAVDGWTPDRAYQRRWALTVLGGALERLEAAYVAEGKGEVFKALRPFLGFGAEQEQGYASVAGELGIAVGTLKSLVFRMRARWRTLLFEDVAATLVHPTEQAIKDELSELLSLV